MNANLRGRVRKLENRRGAASRFLLVWTWGKSDAQIEHAIADLHPGPDDIVLPVTWQRSQEAGEPAPVTLGDLNIGERDKRATQSKANWPGAPKLARVSSSVESWCFPARSSEKARSDPGPSRSIPHVWDC